MTSWRRNFKGPSLKLVVLTTWHRVNGSVQIKQKVKSKKLWTSQKLKNYGIESNKTRKISCGSLTDGLTMPLLPSGTMHSAKTTTSNQSKATELQWVSSQRHLSTTLTQLTGSNARWLSAIYWRECHGQTCPSPRQALQQPVPDNPVMR